MKVIAVIDGEHHPDVARDALERLSSQHDVRAVVFAGGQEKVSEWVLADPAAHYGRDVVRSTGSPADALRDAVVGSEAEAVVDLSGDPVLDAPARFRLASVA